MTPAETPLLQAQGITKRFDGVRALDGVPLDVYAGECVGLIGPNGAGKTTLFDCVTGRIAPNAGEVRFQGRRLDGLSGVGRARLGLARTFQRTELFPGMSVGEHLLVARQSRACRTSVWRDLLGKGRPTAAELRPIATILEMLGLGGDADRPVESLTLGQARLVELGRALACDPVLLFLDEPSSGLDRTETQAMASVLEQMRARSGVTILLIEHDVPLVRQLTSRLYVLEAGRVIAAGPTETVLDDPKVRSAYLGVEA